MHTQAPPSGQCSHVCARFPSVLCALRGSSTRTHRACEHNSNTGVPPFQPVSAWLTVTAPFQTPQYKQRREKNKSQILTRLRYLGEKQNAACVKAKSSQGWSQIKPSWVSGTLESAKQNQDCGKEKADPVLCNQTQEQRARCQLPQKAASWRTQVAFCRKKDEAITSGQHRCADGFFGSPDSTWSSCQGCFYLNTKLPEIKLIYLHVRFMLFGFCLTRTDMFTAISNTILPSISPTYSRILWSHRQFTQVASPARHSVTFHYIFFLQSIFGFNGLQLNVKVRRRPSEAAVYW